MTAEVETALPALEATAQATGSVQVGGSKRSGGNHEDEDQSVHPGGGAAAAN